VYGASMDDPKDIAMRVIADHARTLSFALSDGAMPSNEGRGYVLRRILRRALRYAKDLGCNQPILHRLVGTIADSMGDFFPELRDRQDAVARIVKAEEESFLVTLDRGIEIFNGLVGKARAGGYANLGGEDTFKLYDTYGFPFDLTRLMASSAGLQVDGEGFERCMQEQKTRARLDRREKQQGGAAEGSWEWFADLHATEFTGYDGLESDASIIGISKSKKNLLLVLDRTPFYAESGGQTGDRGWIETGEYRLEVTDTQKDGDSFVHVVTRAFDNVRDSEADPADIAIGPGPVHASVNRKLRQATERNHTATHLLHAVLRHTLGQHVQQKGSLVNPERIRFDFSHFSKLTPAEIEAVEAAVNECIRQAESTKKLADVPYDDAIAKGALAFFGDKYADHVRVVEIPGISVELCGGTHVDNVGQIGLFKIVGESSVAAGVRRIEALTGRAAEELMWNEYRELHDVRQLLKLKAEEPTAEKVAAILEERRGLEKQLSDLKADALLAKLQSDAAASEEVQGCRIIASVVEGANAEGLRLAVQALRQKFPLSAGLLCSAAGGKVSLAAFASDRAVKELGIDAGKLVRQAAVAVQGGGGGKAEFATAGGKNPEGMETACSVFREAVRSIADAG